MGSNMLNTLKKRFTVILAIVPVFVTTAGCFSYSHTSTAGKGAMVGGGGSVEAEGLSISAGNRVIRENEPGVVFGTAKLPDTAREISYAVVFNYDDPTDALVTPAEMSSDGSIGRAEQRVIIGNRNFDLQYSIDAKTRDESFTINGSQVPPTDGKVWLVDLRDGKNIVERIDAILPHVTEDMPAQKSIEETAAEILKAVRSHNDIGREFLNGASAAEGISKEG